MRESSEMQTLFSSSDSDVWLIYPMMMDFDEVGNPITFDPFNPDHFGRRFLKPEYEGKMIWTAATSARSTKSIPELHGFHSGAMISPRVRKVIEDYGCTDVEFIPLRVVSAKDKRLIDEWWFVNVFGWRDIFDLKRSKAGWLDFPQPITRSHEWEHRFGDKLMVDIEELVLLPSADLTGLYLAKGPTSKICKKVFIGTELVERLNDGVDPKRRMGFERFLLKDRPKMPQFKMRE